MFACLCSLFDSTTTMNKRQQCRIKRAAFTVVAGLQFPYVDASSRWCVLVLDVQQILLLYLNRRFAHIKALKLCANMCVRGVYTSATLYCPSTLPRDMQLFVPKACTMPPDVCRR